MDMYPAPKEEDPNAILSKDLSPLGDTGTGTPIDTGDTEDTTKKKERKPYIKGRVDYSKGIPRHCALLTSPYPGDKRY